MLNNAFICECLWLSFSEIKFTALFWLVWNKSIENKANWKCISESTSWLTHLFWCRTFIPSTDKLSVNFDTSWQKMYWSTDAESLNKFYCQNLPDVNVYVGNNSILSKLIFKKLDRSDNFVLKIWQSSFHHWDNYSHPSKLRIVVPKNWTIQNYFCKAVWYENVFFLMLILCCDNVPDCHLGTKIFCFCFIFSRMKFLWSRILADLDFCYLWKVLFTITVFVKKKLFLQLHCLKKTRLIFFRNQNMLPI